MPKEGGNQAPKRVRSVVRHLWSCHRDPDEGDAGRRSNTCAREVATHVGSRFRVDGRSGRKRLVFGGSESRRRGGCGVVEERWGASREAGQRRIDIRRNQTCGDFVQTQEVKRPSDGTLIAVDSGKSLTTNSREVGTGGMSVEVWRTWAALYGLSIRPRRRRGLEASTREHERGGWPSEGAPKGPRRAHERHGSHVVVLQYDSGASGCRQSRPRLQGSGNRTAMHAVASFREHWRLPPPLADTGMAWNDLGAMLRLAPVG